MTDIRTTLQVTASAVLACGLSYYALKTGALSGPPAPSPDLVLSSQSQPISRPAPQAGSEPPALAPMPRNAETERVPVRPAQFIRPVIAQRSGPMSIPVADTDTRPDPVQLDEVVVFSPDPDRGYSQFGMPCGLEVTVARAPSAMISVDVAAPCAATEAVTVLHAGVSISTETDAAGLANLELPALADPAVVSVRLSSGLDEMATLAMPELESVERIAIASGDVSGMRLHALGPDAEWFGDGHVHPGAPGRAGDESYMVLVGDAAQADPLPAQVFSTVRGGLGAMDISLDAPITDTNCATVAQFVLVHSSEGRAQPIPVSIAYPDCSAVGETLVLQNFLPDLRLAAN